MKVYFVERTDDNGENYECWSQTTAVVAVCLTEAKAKEYIANLEVKDWIDGKPDEDPWWWYDGIIRSFYRPARSEYCDPQTQWYTIKEMEVTE